MGVGEKVGDRVVCKFVMTADGKHLCKSLKIEAAK